MALLQVAGTVPAERADPGRLFHQGNRLLLKICALGLVIGLGLLLVDGHFFRAKLYGTLMTVSMYRDQDVAWLAICAAFSLYLCWLAGQRGGGSSPLTSPLARFWPDNPSVVRYAGVITALVFGFTVAGTYVFHHAHDVIIDEFMPKMQAEIFLSGDFLARYPDEWADYVKALFPQFIYRDAEHQLWGSIYRPVHAAIIAGFSLLSLGALTNAFLTTLSVVLIVGVARRLWPDRPDAAILAAVLLATGPQFLFNGMAGFAWPAHLCLNLLWLWLFLRDDRLGHGFAALVGFAAVGLHQINAHPVFVLPFMLALLQARRWWLAAFYASVYTAALLIWTLWHDIAGALSAGPLSAGWLTAVPLAAEIEHGAGVGYLSNALSLINWDRLFFEPLMVLNLLRLLAWQNIMILPLIFIALRQWKAAPPVIRLLAWACVLSMIPYVLMMPNQFYAWGYRYAHGLLGSLALIAVHGWVVLSARNGPALVTAKHAIIGFTALMVVIGLPLRAIQIEGFARPFAEANRYIRSLQTDVVLVDAAKVWFSNDVIRNDPYLSGQPVVLTLMNLSPEQLRHICATYSVTVVDHEDLARFDIVMIDRDYAFSEHDETLRAMANGPACQGS